MMKTRDRVLKSRWVGVDELMVAPYYADLYPLPRDLSGLRRNFERHGYRPEYPVVVRTRGGSGGTFEIVCGVGRHAVARERGMRRVPIVVRRFDDDNGARAYAIEDNLFNPAASSRPSLAHMIVHARALKECGVECAPRQVWEAAGVSPSTYWRADGSLSRSLEQVLSAHPELQGLDFWRQVAEIIRKDLLPQFTRLFAGDVEINSYYQAQIRGTPRPARRVEGKARRSRKGGARGRAPETILARSNKSDSEATTPTTIPKRKKPAKNDSNRSLLDLLPS